MEDKPLTILPFSLTHIPQVLAIEQLCFSDPWSEAGFAAELENPLSLFLVACIGQQVAGYLCASVSPPQGYISNLAVHPDARGIGVASALLTQCFVCFSEMQVHTVALEVRQSNASAIALYQKHGFSPVGIRKHYYQTPPEDALVMLQTIE